MRKKDESLHQTLLESARQLADTDGIEAINIRSLAHKAGVAVGTVYNYFSSKEDILLALTEEYWRKTLLDMRTEITASSFCGQLEEIYVFLKERIDNSAGKLMNSLGNVEAAGEKRMASMQAALEAAMMQRMEQDKRIRTDIWDETFSKEQFVRFLMMNITMLLRTKASDFNFFITIVRRTIY